MAPYVKTWTKNRVATVEFFHTAGNSLPSGLLDQLAQTLTEVGQATDSSVIILQSGGDRSFCAGASLTELINIATIDEGEVFFSKFAHVINAMRLCPKFIIGRVQGKAVGGGVGLIAAADYSLATHDAAIKLSELTIGIGPFVIEPALHRKIGMTATSHLTINATEFESAVWGWQKGLYDDIFETPEELDQRVQELARKLATYDPEAMRQMKQVLWEGTDHWDQLLLQRARISGTLVLSDFTQNALAAIRSKR